MKRHRHRGWLVGGSLVLLGAVTFAGDALGDLIEGIPDGYEETRGIVVEGDVTARIRFEDRTGTEVEFEATPSADEGESFTVYYDPADPAGTAFTPEGRRELTVVGFVIAAILAVLATWLLYRYWRGAKPSPESGRPPC